ncbi:hypothetical protein [Streptomyces sp. NPDC048192]|jgi:hypothetical protein|uniref:hypothetical protein n=1 Tax=unclassified Streptomyces TaxID=2593676 RepID=UPI003717D39D
MEDLADEGVVPIFIRCLGHLWVDVKFGQFGDPGDLAEGERPEDRIPAGAHHAPAGQGGPRPPPYDHTAAHSDMQGETGYADPGGADDPQGRRC